jgi:hypothetical protein
MQPKGFQLSNLETPLSVRLAKHPLLGAVDHLAFLAVSQVSQDGRNLHLVAAGLSFDWFADGFGK